MFNQWILGLSGSTIRHSSRFPIVFNCKWKSGIHILNVFMVHMRVYVSGGGGVYTHMETRGQTDAGILLLMNSITIFFFFRHGLSLGWSSLSTLSWLAGKPHPGSACLWLKQRERELRAQPLWSALINVGSEDPHSVPPGCKASWPCPLSSPNFEMSNSTQQDRPNGPGHVYTVLFLSVTFVVKSVPFRAAAARPHLLLFWLRLIILQTIRAW